MYSSEISRTNPTAYVFLVDQSASMADAMVSGTSKAQFVADVINRTLRDLVVRCTREEGVRDYFHVAVIGYGETKVSNALTGNLAGQWLHPISVIADGTIRVEERAKMIDDGAGGLVTQNIKFPVWLDPKAYGGTPMQQAFAQCAQIVGDWSDTHRDSFPATVLHITDGESTDGDPEHNAGILRSMTTTDGSALLYNIHVSAVSGEPIKYPSVVESLSDQYSQLLFRMSSTFPDHIRQYAQDAYGLALGDDSRAMVLNADAEELVKFLDIGSRPAAMR